MLLAGIHRLVWRTDIRKLTLYTFGFFFQYHLVRSNLRPIQPIYYVLGITSTDKKVRFDQSARSTAEVWNAYSLTSTPTCSREKLIHRVHAISQFGETPPGSGFHALEHFLLHSANF